MLSLLGAPSAVMVGENCILQYSQIPSGGFSPTIRSFRLGTVEPLASGFLFGFFLATFSVFFSNLANAVTSFLNLFVHLLEGSQYLIVLHALILRRRAAVKTACGNQTAPLLPNC